MWANRSNGNLIKGCAVPRKYASMEDRIIANSVLSEEHEYNGERCWEWLGRYKVNRSGKRYPVLTMRFKRGPRKGKVRTVLVHRLVIVVFKGRIMTPRMVGMHLCNNSMCVCPNHLEGGTQRKNVRQCVADGRHRNQYSEAVAA